MTNHIEYLLSLFKGFVPKPLPCQRSQATTPGVDRCQVKQLTWRMTTCSIIRPASCISDAPYIVLVGIFLITSRQVQHHSFLETGVDNTDRGRGTLLAGLCGYAYACPGHRTANPRPQTLALLCPSPPPYAPSHPAPSPPAPRLCIPASCSSNAPNLVPVGLCLMTSRTWFIMR